MAVRVDSVASLLSPNPAPGFVSPFALLSWDLVGDIDDDF